MNTRTLIGITVLVAGIGLIGTSGLAFVLGWGLWAIGLTVLLSAVPTRDAGAQVTPFAGAEFTA